MSRTFRLCAVVREDLCDGYRWRMTPSVRFIQSEAQSSRTCCSFIAGSIRMSVWTLVIVSRCVLSPSPSLFLLVYLPLPSKSLETPLRPSSTSPCVLSSGHKQGVCGARLWWHVCTRFAHLSPQTSMQRFSTVPCGCPVGLSGPLRNRGSRNPSGLRSPAALVSLQDLTADTHMVLITRRERRSEWRIWWKKSTEGHSCQ